jgi:glucodextranase-like protein
MPARDSLVRLLGSLAIVASAPAALAGGTSLYSGPGPRPGPDVLYAAPAVAPQLENVGVWSAAPILVSGASAYRRGEFLYQDFLYDDHGAVEEPDPTDPRSGGNLFSKPDGTYTYPTDPAYANDAADLVELRVKPLSDATAFRLTLNTIKDPSLVAFSIGIGGTPGVLRSFPAGANVQAPADLFLTVHPAGAGMTGDLVDAATGQPVVGPAPLVAVDTGRRQIEVRVPHAAWNPGGRVVRLTAGVGLWDKANGRYLLPQAAADAAHPGGAGAAVSPAAFFNVAFRYDEPMPAAGDPAGTATGPAWWRDKHQGEALAAGDVSPFHADVDFAKLAAAVNDDMPGRAGGVPQTGPMDRILVSRFEIGQGADFSVNCFPGSTSGGTNCPGQYQGVLQPYAIYVPSGPMPRQGYGMTLLLHSLSTNCNQYLGSRNQSQFGDRDGGSIVITPEARGPDGFYDSYAGADVFEVWADVTRRYRLDPDWTVITGYSMGGIGTFKLAEQFPDLFARGQPTVGFSGDDNLVASLRNIPFLMWNSLVDELVPPTDYVPTAETFDRLGYRYELDVFTPGDHLTLSINDQFAPAAAFLDLAKVNRNPAHVTYVIDPTLDYPALGFVADHAYWLSGITLRSATPPVTGGHAEGSIDALSYGFGVGDPTPSATQFGAGTLTGGNLPTPLAYTRQYRTWGPVPPIPGAKRIDLTARNIAAVTINVRRAGVGCGVDLHVDTDGPIAIALDGCGRTIQAGGGA